VSPFQAPPRGDDDGYQSRWKLFQTGCLSTARARIAGSAGIYCQASTDGRDHRSEHLSFANFRYLAASADAGNFSRQGDEFRSDLSNRSDYADWQSRFGPHTRVGSIDTA
jgi:hypothetical protein